MDMKLKTATWDQMVETDRMACYYGYLAGKLSKREKVASVVTTALGVVSAYSVANSVTGDSWTWWAGVAIAFSTLTVAASVIPLVFRYSDAISSAAYCQTRLDALSVRCKDLWLVRDTIDADEAMRRWQALAREQSAITAFQSAKPLDRKLSKSTTKETNEYWQGEADRLNRIAEKGRRRAVQTVGQENAISAAGRTGTAPA